MLEVESVSNKKIYYTDEAPCKASQIGATLEALARTIEARSKAGEESYTYRLLNDMVDTVCKKIVEEAGETAIAGKEVDLLSSYASQEIADAARDHLRYEAADVVYHTLVLLARVGISLDEFAAELNMRMQPAERPAGAVRLHDQYIRRGK